MLRSVVVLLLVVGVVGCGGAESAEALPSTTDDAAEALPPITDDESVFLESTVRTYQLSLAEEEWKRLLEEAREEEYIPAYLAVDGEPFGTVALRAKGAHGTLFSCFEEDELLCSKLSLKLRFDKYDRDKRLGGLRRLNLHSMERDSTLLRERIAYQLFQDMGVAAPRSAHVQVSVNGRLLGLYAAVEQVDASFLESRFPEDPHGRLYKELWPRPESRERIVARLKEGDASGPFGIVDFAHALMAPNPVALAGTLRDHMDVASLARMVAVEDALGHWDGIFRLACRGGECRNHNVYIYESSDAQSFTLIPWDYDRALPADRERLSGVPHWSDESAPCSMHYVDNRGGSVMAPACDPVFRGLVLADRGLVEEAYAALAQGPFDPERMRERARQWQDILAPFVASDPDRSLEQWQSAVDDLLEEHLAAAHAELSAATDVVATRAEDPQPLEHWAGVWNAPL